MWEAVRKKCSQHCAAENGKSDVSQAMHTMIPGDTVETQRLMVALLLSFSVQIFIFENNIYYRATVESRAIRLVSTGKERVVFNGLADWLYEGMYDGNKQSHLHVHILDTINPIQSSLKGFQKDVGALQELTTIQPQEPTHSLEVGLWWQAMKSGSQSSFLFHLKLIRRGHGQRYVQAGRFLLKQSQPTISSQSLLGARRHCGVTVEGLRHIVVCNSARIYLEAHLHWYEGSGNKL